MNSDNNRLIYNIKIIFTNTNSVFSFSFPLAFRVVAVCANVGGSSSPIQLCCQEPCEHINEPAATMTSLPCGVHQALAYPYSWRSTGSQPLQYANLSRPSLQRLETPTGTTCPVCGPAHHRSVLSQLADHHQVPETVCSFKLKC